MRAIVLGVLVAAVVGCGGDGGDGIVQPPPVLPPAPTIVGEWGVTKGNCGEIVQFSVDGTYVLSLGCDAQVEVEGGTYGYAASTLSFTPKRSTCANAAFYSVTYSLSDPLLLFFLPDGTVLSFERVNPPPVSGVIQLGCFNGSQFTPGPIVNL